MPNRDDILSHPLALLEGAERIAGRLLVFTDAGHIQANTRPHSRLCALLERIVVEVAAPQGGAFHPKMWALRFTPLRPEGNAAAEPIPSYLIECLVWNAPNDAFTHDQYAENLRAILLHLYSHTQSDDACREWGEVNELKYIFRATQPWTRQAVQSFVVAAWNRAGFK